MRIAITGGTGFVGGHLARALAAAGHHVVIIARGLDRRDDTIRHLPNVTFHAFAWHRCGSWPRVSSNR